MISFVVVARNDNYGGDFTQRMQTSVDVLLGLAEKHGLDIELVIVEWNPPKNNPPLASALTWVRGAKHCSVRIIEVPENVHKQLPNSEKVPLFEYLGKNVGVRRANGEFILVTNPDILFTEPLIQFLSTHDLSQNCFYRTTRFDVASPVPSGLSTEELFAYCRHHVTRINGYLGSFDNRLRQRLNLYKTLYNILDFVTWRVRYFPYELPFTNASGDFMLMHRDNWHFLHGYPQVFGSDSHGLFHVDSFNVIEALFHGLKQVRLNGEQRIYHQEHNRPDNKRLFSAEVDLTRQRLLQARKPLVINDENWGLGDYTLPESKIL